MEFFFCLFVYRPPESIRKQKIICLLPGHFSSLKTVTCGVPQGLTLGPIFFLFYIYDYRVPFQNQLFTILQMTLSFYFLANTWYIIWQTRGI